MALWACTLKYANKLCCFFLSVIKIILPLSLSNLMPQSHYRQYFWWLKTPGKTKGEMPHNKLQQYVSGRRQNETPTITTTTGEESPARGDRPKMTPALRYGNVLSFPSPHCLKQYCGAFLLHLGANHRRLSCIHLL